MARCRDVRPEAPGVLPDPADRHFIAKALSKVANKLLERVGFDRWVERGSLKTAFERSQTDASDLIGVIVFWLVFLVALQLAFGSGGQTPSATSSKGSSGTCRTSSSPSSSW